MLQFQRHERPRLLRFIHHQGRDIGDVLRPHQRDQLRIDRRVADAVPQRIDPGGGGDLRPRQRDTMGNHRQSRRMRIRDDRRQRRHVHAGQVGRAAIAPAIGEHLDDVGLVRQRGPHRDMRGARGGRGQREEAAPAIFGAMPARHPQPDGEVQPRRRGGAIGGDGADRVQHLARQRKVVGAGNPVRQMRGPRLAQVVGTAIARCAQMGVQVMQPGQQRQPARIDHPRPARSLQPRPDRGDPVADDQHVARHRRRAGPVEHPRAADQHRLAPPRRPVGGDQQQGQQREQEADQHGSMCTGYTARVQRLRGRGRGVGWRICRR